MIGKVPQGWQVKTLGEVTDIFKGGTPKRNVERYFQGNIAWATPTDITNLNGALYIDDTETHISEEALGKSSARLLPVGTVLLTSRATIGKVAITRVPIATNQGFANFLCKEGIVNLFLAYYLRLNTDLLISLGTGTTFLEVTKATLLNVEIPFPPLPTQRKIAAVLSAYDDLIENNIRRIEILEEMAKAIYRQWFVEFRFPGHEGVEMVESELGLIPQGWAVGTLGDILENVKEKVKPGKHLEPLPYIPIDCIPRRSIALIEHKPSSEAKSSLVTFKRNDILFGAMRSYFHKVIFAPFDGITRQTCFVLRSKTPDSYPFDLFTMFQDSTVKYSSNYSTGSTIPYATWDGVLAQMSIVRPPDLLIEKFSGAVVPMLDSIQVLTMKNANLRQTRDLLLPKLISGEIDVSELDIDINRRE